MVLHYGQGVFEGLKAYRTENGGVQLYRIGRIGVEGIIPFVRHPSLLVPKADGRPGAMAVIADGVGVNGRLQAFSFGLFQSAGEDVVALVAVEEVVAVEVGDVEIGRAACRGIV